VFIGGKDLSCTKGKTIGTNLDLLARFPMSLLIVPAAALFSFVVFIACYFFAFIQNEYRSLFKASLTFRVGTTALYIASLIPLFVLKLYFPDSSITIFSDLFFVCGLISSIFYYGHFYQSKYLVNAGWTKSNELLKQEMVLVENSKKLSSTAAWIMVFLIFLVILFVIGLS
jgi:hypothetical protein